VRPDAAGILGALAETGGEAAVMAAVVAILVRIAGARLAPAVRYGLWLLVLARLCLPVLPSAPWSPWRLPSFAQEPSASRLELPPSVPSGISTVPVVAAKPTHIEAGPAPGNRLEAIVIAWLAGTLLVTIWYAIAWMRLHRRVAAAAPVRDRRLIDLVRVAAARAGMGSPPGLVELLGAAGPALFGVVRPVILLPSGLAERLDDEALTHLLAHECIHHRRHDLAVAWLAMGVCAIHWWNPAAWLVARRLRAAQELACDAETVAGFAADRPLAYAASLVRLAELVSGRHSSLTAGATSTRNHLLERIAMIDQPVISRPLRIAGTLLLIAAASVALVKPPAAAETPVPTANDGAGAQAEDPWRKTMRERMDHLVMTFEFADTDFSDVIDFFRQITGLNIVVSPEVLASRPAPITLTVKGMSFKNALDFVTALAGTNWRIDDHAILIRTRSVAEARAFQAEKDAADGPWRKDMMERMERSRVTFEFVGTDIVEAVTYLRQATEFTIVLDPAIIANGPADIITPPITLAVRDMPFKDALSLVTTLTGLSWSLADQAVFIQRRTLSVAEIRALQAEMMTDRQWILADGPGKKPWSQAIHEALAQAVTVDFHGTTLADALAFLQRVTGSKFIIDPEIVAAGGLPVTLVAERMQIREVLPALMRQTGLEYGIHDQAVWIYKPVADGAER
jgi:beta-lactamase regulating signal transducer with metallopeptidase domain